MNTKIISPIAEGFCESIYLVIRLCVGIVTAIADISAAFINHGMLRPPSNNDAPSHVNRK